VPNLQSNQLAQNLLKQRLNFFLKISIGIRGSVEFG